MLHASLVARTTPSTRQDDALRVAVERLSAALPGREDNKVLVDFLEDDLREGLSAIEDVEAHFAEILEALRSERLSPIVLLDVGDDLLALGRLEQLVTVVTQLRRRLAQAAGRMRDARGPAL